jgi:FkbM family methyltransferase
MKAATTLGKILEFYGCYLPNHPKKWLLHSYMRRVLRVSEVGPMHVRRLGLEWNLDPADYVQADLFWLGQRDTWDVYHLRRIAQPSSNILDIGANFGYYSLILAASLQRQCAIHAFDPNPSTFDRLLKNIQLNSMQSVVEAHRLGLSDMETVVTLDERPGNSGATRLTDSLDGIKVQVTTVDAFCRTQTMKRVDLLKIDVEGYEARVLRGANQTISRHKPAIFIELFPKGLERQGSSAEEVVSLLTAHGYDLFEANRKRLVPLKHLPSGAEHTNLFCLHAGRKSTP